MFRVTTTVSFCYGHRLLNYDGKCKHLHGHNARAVITLESESLDHRGMVIDFNDIKSVVKEWIDGEIDHKMLLSINDPIGPLLKAEGEALFLMEDNPTAENIAKLIYKFVTQKGFPVKEVVLWETDNSYATYTGS